NSPKAFALVVGALIRKQDYRASMALLMMWLSQAEDVPLEEGDFSFHHLTLLWMLGLCALVNTEVPGATQSPAELAVKFFDYLEANAEDFGLVPRLDLLGTGGDPADGPAPKAEEEEDSLYGAAYEDMTYKD